MTGRRLNPALLISLLAHAGILVFAAPLVVSSVPPAADRPLQVTLEPVAMEPSPHREGLRTRPQSASPGLVPRETVMRAPLEAETGPTSEPDVSVSDSVHERMEAPESAAALSAAVAAEPPPEAFDTAAGAEAEIVSQLRDALQTHFYYPALARHRGWEGSVTVGVRVQADGRLTDIRVIRSSGYVVLDGAAVDCLRRAARLPGARYGLETGLDIVLPVRYLLIDAPA